MNIEVKKDTTFKFRMDDITKDLLERARLYLNINKSKFIRESIREKAEFIIAEHDKTSFDASDWRMFFDMLDKPAEPTPRMKKAALKYQQIISSNGI
jgi:uncharacterized protein (DUF1778 family)